MRHDGLAIGELSQRTGCNIETIRYYERIGLLPSPHRQGRYCPTHEREPTDIRGSVTTISPLPVG